jgi:hypothetical protein
MILHRYEEALAMFEHLPARTYRVAALVAGCHARLGNFERSRASAAECPAKKPEFSIRHYVKKMPFKDPADAETLTESLALAGLPA